MQKKIYLGENSVFYEIGGSGHVVVLLHGFLENMTVWNTFALSLQSNFKTICIDLPGFGKSSVFSEKHDMDFMAEVVNSVLEKEGVQQCNLVGHSMGGYVSLSFAKLYPEKVKSLCLFHSQALADSDEAKQNRNRTIELVKKQKDSFIKEFVPLLFAEQNVLKHRQEIKKLTAMCKHERLDGITAALAGMRDRQDSSEVLKKAEFPVYFIVGKDDSRIPIDVVLPQLKLPSNSEAIILSDCGHIGFIEKPEETLKGLTAFLLKLNN